MKIKNEYAILSECVERGIDRGYARAFKHTDAPTEDVIKLMIYDAVTAEVSEYFSFDDKGCAE